MENKTHEELTQLDVDKKLKSQLEEIKQICNDYQSSLGREYCVTALNVLTDSAKAFVDKQVVVSNLTRVEAKVLEQMLNKRRFACGFDGGFDYLFFCEKVNADTTQIDSMYNAFFGPKIPHFDIEDINLRLKAENDGE